MLTLCNFYVLWLLRYVQLRLVTVTFCDINFVWCYALSQYPLSIEKGREVPYRECHNPLRCVDGVHHKTSYVTKSLRKTLSSKQEIQILCNLHFLFGLCSVYINYCLFPTVKCQISPKLKFNRAGSRRNKKGNQKGTTSKVVVTKN